MFNYIYNDNIFIADLIYVKSAQIIESKQFFIGIIHRFYGDYATTQSLGMKEGANFAMDGVLSLSPNRNLLLNYNNQNSEFSAGIKQTLFTFKDVSNSFKLIILCMIVQKVCLVFCLITRIF